MKRSAIPLLGLLTVQPMSGYEMKKAIDDSLGNFWSESFGQIYPLLAKLAGDGLIEAVEEDARSAGRRKTTYAITEKGRQALKSWLAEEPARQVMRNELLLKIFFASEIEPEIIAGHLERELATARARLEKFTRIEQSLKQAPYAPERVRYWSMTLRYGLMQTRAMIGWCEETLGEFRSSEEKSK